MRKRNIINLFTIEQGFSEKDRSLDVMPEQVIEEEVVLIVDQRRVDFVFLFVLDDLVKRIFCCLEPL